MSVYSIAIMVERFLTYRAAKDQSREFAPRVAQALKNDRIEEAITPATTAILPVHCYGLPCDVDRIQRIADTYGLKIIYDAAHAFGVRQDGVSILRHGTGSGCWASTCGA